MFFFVITSKQDKVNNAYSAFIFLKILSIQLKWSEWSERSRKVLLEPLDSQGGQDNHSRASLTVRILRYEIEKGLRAV